MRSAERRDEPMKTHPTVLVTENIGYLPSEDTGTLGDMLPPCLSACLQALLVIRLTMRRPFDRKSIGYETPQHRSLWDFSLFPWNPTVTTDVTFRVSR